MIKIITKSLCFLFLSLFVNNLYSQDTKWKALFKKDDLSEFIILNGNATFQIENKILLLRNDEFLSCTAKESGFKSIYNELVFSSKA